MHCLLILTDHLGCNDRITDLTAIGCAALLALLHCTQLGKRRQRIPWLECHR
jgi:hypothetical protein